MNPRRRTRNGWFFTVTGVLACPCHLVVTLPLAVALLGGTALGGWISTHEGAIALGATLYFVSALALGATLLLARTTQPAADMGGIDEAASTCCPANRSFGRPAGEATGETTRAEERAEAEGLGSH